MNIKISDELYTLAKAFALADATLYVVGGYVRNSLVGLPVTDIDITGKLRAEEVEKISRHLGFRAQVVNAKLGTLLITGEHDQYEYTCFRTENYPVDSGEHTPTDVAFTDDIRLDATRRDFTMNALYYDILGDKVLDFYKGLQDLNKGKIRQIAIDTLSSDGLRILRMVRFASELNFSIEKKTYNSAKVLGKRLKDISKERFIAELKKIAIADLKYFVNGASPLIALDYISKLNLWQYIFDFDIDFKINRCVFRQIVKVNRPARYLYFLFAIMYSAIGRQGTTRANIDYVANMYIGTALRESKDTVKRLKDFYLFLSTVNSDYHRYKCAVAYSKFDDEEVNILKTLYFKCYTDMEQALAEMKTKNIPFEVKDLSVTADDLVKAGVKQTSLSLVMQRLVSLCLDETIKNEKSALISAINDNTLV